MRNIKFVTIDWGLNYKHYAKDVGMIPYLLEKKYGYNSIIVGTNEVDNYSKPYLDYNVKTDIVEKYHKSDFLNVARYIRKNAKDIDVLNIYHMNIKYNLLLILLFKIFNRNGIVYLKLDMGYRGAEICENDSLGKKMLKTLMLRSADLISNENTEVCKIMESIYGIKISYIPNGWYGTLEKNKNCVRDIPYLYVGRIGIREKGVDVLLEAYSKSNHKSDLYLVGRVENSFANYIETYFEKNPELKDKVHFLGEVRDRQKLNELYNRTQALIVPSRWESFGIVMVEAQAHGCYIISSDQVSSFYDVVLCDEMGVKFQSENVEELAGIMDEKIFTKADRVRIYHNSEKFKWDIIIDKLYSELTDIMEVKNNHEKC
jgi:glycosyltransferase involved in cell wall biosynthesis